MNELVIGEIRNNASAIFEKVSIKLKKKRSPEGRTSRRSRAAGVVASPETPLRMSGGKAPVHGAAGRSEEVQTDDHDEVRAVQEPAQEQYCAACANAIKKLQDELEQLKQLASGGGSCRSQQPVLPTRRASSAGANDVVTTGEHTNTHNTNLQEVHCPMLVLFHASGANESKSYRSATPLTVLGYM